MERLTSNKPVEEMNMVELAHNACYAENRKAMYRDFETARDARDFARELYEAYVNKELPTDDDEFDDRMIDDLQYEPTIHANGLIALFYRNLWAMADLREKLKRYEDAEEQGVLLRLPCREAFESGGDTIYYIFDYEVVECINCGISIDCDGKIWIALACDEHIFPYRNPDPEHDLDPTDWCINTTQVTIDEWGKTVFPTEEAALRKLESEDKADE